MTHRSNLIFLLLVAAWTGQAVASDDSAYKTEIASIQVKTKTLKFAGIVKNSGSTKIISPREGVLVFADKLKNKFAKGELIARVNSMVPMQKPYFVRAPASGFVTAVATSDERFVRKGEAMFVFTSSVKPEYYVEMRAAFKDLAHLKEGAQLAVSVEKSSEDSGIVGLVISKSPVIEAATATYPFTLKLQCVREKAACAEQLSFHPYIEATLEVEGEPHVLVPQAAFNWNADKIYHVRKGVVQELVVTKKSPAPTGWKVYGIEKELEVIVKSDSKPVVGSAVVAPKTNTNQTVKS